MRGLLRNSHLEQCFHAALDLLECRQARYIETEEFGLSSVDAYLYFWRCFTYHLLRHVIIHPPIVLYQVTSGPALNAVWTVLVKSLLSVSAYLITHLSFSRRMKSIVSSSVV